MSKDKYDKSKPLKAYVWLKKKEVPFISFFIEQAFYEHHTFVVHIDSKVLEDKFLELPENNFNLLGELLGINIYHANQEGYVDSFNGIITDVKMSGKDRPGGGPDQQEIILSGYSLSILMDNGPRLEVYSDRTLTAIADYLCARELDHLLRNQVMVENNAILEFSMQYFESDWEMYRRLAIEYGEMMYFTGVELRFGNNCKQRPERTLTYDIDFCEIEVCGRLLPKRVDHYDYRADSNSRLTQSQNVPDDASRFVKTVAQRSERAFLGLRYPELPTPVGAQSQQDIDLLASAYEGRNATNMVYITGKSRTTNHARIGHTITLDLPKSMGVASTIGRYRVVKATHAFTERGEYEGTFEAVPADLKYAPAPKITRPIADSILAKVISNEDPLGQGRVQVEFPFPNSMDSNWLRVMSPDAGGSGGNHNQDVPGRGLIAIPEVDDQVMVGFEFGNPNKPYVMGSMFHGKVATGGGVDNHIKSFITKSGHTIEFDDAKDTLGITIKDKVGNSIHLDTKGKNIEITAPEKISIVAKELSIDTDKISLNAKNDISLSTQSLMLEGKDKLNAVGSNINISAYSNLRTYGSINKIMGKQKVELAGPKIESILSGYSGTANYSNRNLSTSSSKNSSATSAVGKVANQGQSQATEDSKNVVKQDASKMEQLKKDYYQDYADWIQDLINVLADWNNYMGTVDNTKTITIKTVIGQIIYLFKIKPEIRFVSDQVIFLGEKFVDWINSEGKISYNKFYSNISKKLSELKYGVENKENDMIRGYDRDEIFDKFLKYCQERGASKPEDFTSFLDPFFASVRSHYSRTDFFRTLTNTWLLASEDSWDLDNYAGVLEIRLVLKNIPLVDAIKGRNQSPPEWDIVEFYIDDLTKEDGVLAALKSEYFNNGDFYALNLRMNVRLHLTTNPNLRTRYDLYPQQEVVYTREVVIDDKTGTCSFVWKHQWGTKKMFEDFQLLKHDKLLSTKNLQKD